MNESDKKEAKELIQRINERVKLDCYGDPFMLLDDLETFLKKLI